MAYALKPDEARGANPFGPPCMHRLEHFLVFYALGRMAVSIYLVLGGSCLHIYHIRSFRGVQKPIPIESNLLLLLPLKTDPTSYHGARIVL